MPSLVTLSHVCSHLQNASLARLALTSIPYTRLHLSLALLLQKQGFLSQVKLGGPSPPASCFPSGLRDGRHGNFGSVDGEDTLGGESALRRMANRGNMPENLREVGFGAEAVEFATSRRLKTKEQLEREGWDQVAAEFFAARHAIKTPKELVGDEAQQIFAVNQSMLEDCREDVFKWHPNLRPDGREFRAHLTAALLRNGFEASTLRYFARQSNPENEYVTLRDLERDGMDIDTPMGLTVPNQPFQPPPVPHLPAPGQTSLDPEGLETEGVVTQSNRASRRLWLGLKYWDGAPVLSKAHMISKPSKRIWLDYKDLGKVTRGNRAGEVKPLTKVGEIMAVLTRKGGGEGVFGGVMEARECAERKVDGMVLCRIW